MLLLALGFHLREIVFETFMLNILVVLNLSTIDAFLMRSMMASTLNSLYIMRIHSQAVNASPVWSMVAMTFLHFLFSLWFRLLLMK